MQNVINKASVFYIRVYTYARGRKEAMRRQRGKTLHQQIMREAAVASRTKPRMPVDQWCINVNCPECGNLIAFNHRSTVRKCRNPDCGANVSRARVDDQIREHAKSLQ